MPLKDILDQLKALDLNGDDVSLVIVTERQRQGQPYFKLKYVRTEPILQTRLRRIVVRTIQDANAVQEYTFDCPEPEADEVRGMNSGGTSFEQIAQNLQGLNPELDTIEDEEELFKAKAYLIVLRNEEGVRVIAFKTLPESWKMKKAKHLIPLLFQEHQFVDLEENSVFNIASTVDIIFYAGTLFILSKKDFERGLNFKDGMITAAQLVYEEAAALDLFLNLDILQNRVGTNLRYLRRIATMSNLGYFRDAQFRQKMKEIVELREWGIGYDEHRIVITEETLDDILTLLQNKRLRSEITENDFDVDHAKPLFE
jgi:hypothetical protein